MSKTAPKRVIAVPSVAEDRKIRRAATADPDSRPLTRTQLAEMVPIAAVRGRRDTRSDRQ